MIIAQNKLGTTIYYEEEKLLVSIYKGRIIINMGLEHLASIVEFYKKMKYKVLLLTLRKCTALLLKYLSI